MTKHDLSISPILSEKDFNQFATLFVFNISVYYPFSSTLTAEAIVNIHKQGVDLNGYFTKKKTIWKLIDKRIMLLDFLWRQKKEEVPSNLDQQ